MIDFHSHILPEMDDCSRGINQSIEMLRLAEASETDAIVATPHFQRRKETIESFLSRRAKAIDCLSDALNDGQDYPQILLGAETEFFLGIGREEGIDKLCIPGTRFLLLEMPFGEWNSLVMSDVRTLCCSKGVTPIIAHVERFFHYPNALQRIDELLELDVVLQTNAEAVVKGHDRRRVLHMIGKDEIQILGSDCHDTIHRPPGLSAARYIIISKLGRSVMDRIDSHGEDVLYGADYKIGWKP